MPDPDPGHQFLLAEFESLSQTTIARNEKLDRYVTIFVTLAGAPAGAYALLAKPAPAGFHPLSPPVGAVALLVGFLGLLLALIVAQVRFNIILYVRATNAIRGHFAAKGVADALLLPTRPDVPPYYERLKHTQFMITAMGLVNGCYVGLGFHALARRIDLAVVAGVVFLAVHLFVYWWMARERDAKDKGPGRLRF